jgi:hypothetical protein
MVEINRLDGDPYCDFVDERGHKFEEYPEGSNCIGMSAIAGYFLGQQSQYASRFVDGILPEYPNLGEGLRYEGSSRDYHFMSIHFEDIDEFVKRVVAFRAVKYGWTAELVSDGHFRRRSATNDEITVARDFLLMRDLPIS